MPGPDDLPAINRRIYAELDRLLVQRGMAGQALFLNWGYAAGLPDGDDEALLAPPPSTAQQPQWRLILEALGPEDPSGRDVLDVGCGRGGALTVLARQFRCRSLSGIDIGEANISHCRRLPDLAGARLQPGDACRLPYRDGSFDLVLNVESSCSYPDFRGFLGHVHRVLRPDGRFILVDLVPQEMLVALRREIATQGFDTLRERDVTNAVLRAREIAAGVEEAVFTGLEAEASPEVAAFLETYRAGPGTALHRAMRHGSVRYMIFHLRRADRTAATDLPPMHSRAGALHALLRQGPGGAA